MRSDLDKVIAHINGRCIQFPNAVTWKGSEHLVKSRTNAMEDATSMKGLRNRLEYHSKLVFDYFPKVYEEKLKDIERALNYSCSAGMKIPSGTKIPMSEDELTRVPLKTGNSFKFKKSNKVPKWKSIWNGYHKHVSKSRAKSLITKTRYPTRHSQGYYRPLGPTICQNLKHHLEQLDPKLRNIILFKNNYTTPNPKIIGRQYPMDFLGLLTTIDVRRYYNTTEDDSTQLMTLLFYVIEESKKFYGNYNSLFKPIITATSALHFLLRRSIKAIYLKELITKYALSIRKQSPSYRLSLLVTCLKYEIDLEVVRLMFEKGIFDLAVITCDKKMYKSSKRVTIAYHIAVSAFKLYNNDGLKYLTDFTNLIIDFCSGLLHQKSSTAVVMANVTNTPGLKNFQTLPTFKSLVETAFQQIPYHKPQRYENEFTAKFFEQYYRYCKKQSTKKRTKK